MNLDACIAQAISSEFDILNALPEVHDLPLHELESYVEEYILTMHESLRSVIEDCGEQFILSQDAAGLCACCLDAGITVPSHMLINVCRAIIQQYIIAAECMLQTPDGQTIWWMKMNIDPKNILVETAV